MDSVTVRCNGGISALSAFFTGYGSSMCIDAPLEIVMSEGDGRINGSHDTIDRTVRSLQERFEVHQPLKVRVVKALPAGKGLKSSSALTLSIVLGFSKLNSISLDDEKILKLSAELSIENGTSLTGAYDDLCSSYYGGVCLSNNRKNEIIFRRSIEELPVIVSYGSSRRVSASVDLTETARYSRHAEEIYRLVNDGRYYEAMTLNGNLMGYIYGQNDDLIRYFLSTGAIYSAQCGKGPAVFAVFGSNDEADLSEEGVKEMRGVEYMRTTFSNTGSFIH